MNTIGELLNRDLSHRIEEIVKVDQHDEESVYAEISEYVATDGIKRQFQKILKAIAEAPAEPTEGIGVWISGFFGSGKSSFAKLLGYVLSNRTVLSKPAAELFKKQLDDAHLSSLIDSVNARIPTEVIMFDVSVDRAVRTSSERIAEIMYTVLLRQLGYAEDFDVAELEIELEKENRLDEFLNKCFELYGIEWKTVRKGAQKLSRSSEILHRLHPGTYPSADSWAKTIRENKTDITVGTFVERTFELCSRRRPGKALVFIIDEVGQYVARSAEKIEDLRAVVEQFGKYGKNLLKAKKIVAPVWVIVTSQEKLDEVVSALDSKKVELAKMQDRFNHRIDFAPNEIREVATKRVLSKKNSAIPLLTKLFQQSQGQLNASCHLTRTSRKSDITEQEFIHFYPYLPHFIELSIDIMSGIRLQPGAPRHLGGSNRTIIKQTYEMLVSDRTNMAGAQIGSLVTMDKIYELVEGNLANEKQKDISDIKSRFKGDAELGDCIVRVAKTICLLEFVRDLPRTEENISALLVDGIGKPSPIEEVKQSIEKLVAADFVIQKEDGYELLTPTDKNWQREKRGFLDPKPRDRNEIVRATIGDIFNDPRMKIYRYRDLKNFKIFLSVDGTDLGESGHIPLAILTEDDIQDLPAKIAETREESRRETKRNQIYWVFSLTSELDELVANLFASREMIRKYDQLRSQNRITSEEADCLLNEKVEAQRIETRLASKLSLALQSGTGLFRGIARDGATLGKTLEEIIKRLSDACVPELYGKLEMGTKPLKGDEAEEILKAANLSGLSLVFYDGPQGLGLVKKDNQVYYPNQEAPVVKEILDYLIREHGYGNKDSRFGKAIEHHFGGIGYGWDMEVVRLALSVLFRAGIIEVNHGAKRFDSYLDPLSRAPFSNTPAFRSSLFTPVAPPDIKILTQAVERYEELVGKTVDAERNSIAIAFKAFIDTELSFLLPLEAITNANRLPLQKTIRDYKLILEEIKKCGVDESVSKLAGEGTTINEARQKIRKIALALDNKGLLQFKTARIAHDGLWPQLENEAGNGTLKKSAIRLGELLLSEEFVLSMDEIKSLTEQISNAYLKAFLDLHVRRSDAFVQTIEQIKGRPEWVNIPLEMRDPLLASLKARSCENYGGNEFSTSCKYCSATLSQMESDLAALGGLRAQVLARIQEILTPKEKVQRIRLSEYFSDSLDSEDSINMAVEQLREQLLKLLAEGARIIIE